MRNKTLIQCVISSAIIAITFVAFAVYANLVGIDFVNPGSLSYCYLVAATVLSADYYYKYMTVNARFAVSGVLLVYSLALVAGGMGEEVGVLLGALLIAAGFKAMFFTDLDGVFDSSIPSYFSIAAGSYFVFSLIGVDEPYATAMVALYIVGALWGACLIIPAAVKCHKSRA